MMKIQPGFAGGVHWTKRWRRPWKTRTLKGVFRRVFNHHTTWLAAVAVAAAGGWYVGTRLPERLAEPELKKRIVPMPAGQNRLAIAPGSPADRWAVKVRGAGAADFPVLLKEWEALEDSEDFPESRFDNGVRWLIAEWIGKDPESFHDASRTAGYRSTAGELFAQIWPEKAAALIRARAAPADPFDPFSSAVEVELAARHPDIYLKADPGGDAGQWVEAIQSLAKSNPLAAAKAWLNWKDTTEPADTKALFAVVSAWQAKDPEAAQNWARELPDPEMRHVALHAWLSMLARQDPRAALEKLRSLDPGEFVDEAGIDDPEEGFTSRVADARLEIARQLAKTDLAAALQAMDQLGAQFRPAGEDEAGGETAETESSRTSLIDAVVSSGEKNLPDEPGAFFENLRRLTMDLNLQESGSPYDVEAEFIKQKITRWDCGECLVAASLRATGDAPAENDAILESLLERAAAMDPEKAAARLQEFSPAVRDILVSQLASAGWNADGEANEN